MPPARRTVLIDTTRDCGRRGRGAGRARWAEVAGAGWSTELPKRLIGNRLVQPQQQRQCAAASLCYGAQGNKCSGAHLQVRLEQLQQLFEQALLRTQRDRWQMKCQWSAGSKWPAVRCRHYSRARNRSHSAPSGLCMLPEHPM